MILSPVLLSWAKITIWGMLGQPLDWCFTRPLVWSWGKFHFCHSFLIKLDTTTPILGSDLWSQLSIKLLLPPGEYSCLPFIEMEVDHTFWSDNNRVGRARTATPVEICFCHPKQYPFKPKAKKVAIVLSVTWEELLIECLPHKIILCWGSQMAPINGY